MAHKLENLDKMGYKVMTVSELLGRLAGLPPMMEVFIDAAGEAMYLNETQLQESDGYAPFLRLIANQTAIIRAADERSYDEQLDEQKQRAMHMGAVIERESRMSERVD